MSIHSHILLLTSLIFTQPIYFAPTCAAPQSEQLSVEQTYVTSASNIASFEVRSSLLAMDETATTVIDLMVDGLLLHHVKRDGGWVTSKLRLTYPDKNPWPLASVDSAVLSSDGERLLLMEEDGRFAVINFRTEPAIVKSGWLPFLVAFSMNDEDLVRQRVSFAEKWVIVDNAYVTGLRLVSATWVQPEGYICLGYEDGRIVEYDTNSMTMIRTIRDSDWGFHHSETFQDKFKTVHDQLDASTLKYRALCREIPRHSGVWICDEPKRSCFPRQILKTKTQDVVHIDRKLEIFDVASGQRLNVQDGYVALQVTGEDLVTLGPSKPDLGIASDVIQLINVSTGKTSRAWMIPHLSASVASFPVAATMANDGFIHVLFAGNRLTLAILDPSGGVQLHRLTEENVPFSFRKNSVAFAANGLAIHALVLPRTFDEIEPEIQTFRVSHNRDLQN